MNTSIDLEITAQEERLTQATRSVDVDVLDRIYADDLMFTGVTGAVCSKATVMEEARRGVAERQAAARTTPAVVSYEKDDLQIAAHGETVVTSYQFGVRIRHEDKDIVRKFRTTNVWMKRQSHWQGVAAHTASLG
jgi:ketosteroid isomerase-like protein